jgi:hypothetical protein
MTGDLRHASSPQLLDIPGMTSASRRGLRTPPNACSAGRFISIATTASSRWEEA